MTQYCIVFESDKGNNCKSELKEFESRNLLIIYCMEELEKGVYGYVEAFDKWETEGNNLLTNSANMVYAQ